MEFLLVLVNLVFIVLYLRQMARLEELESRVAAAEYLSGRISALEEMSVSNARARVVVPTPAVAPPPIPVPPPVPVPVVVVPKPEPVVVKPFVLEPKPDPMVVVPPPLPAPVYKIRTPEPTLAERSRKWLGDEEWETLVGGSIINKIGAFVLVIGIALFLGYSFGHAGPTSRALASIALSGALLAGGVFAEKRATFRVFSRGLIGAGWAALYATAWAIYAVPAAQIIHDDFLGSLGVLAVACGMIAHSLKYRSQSVTAIAYFAAFGAIAISPLVAFAVIGLVPLAASLLYLASRFNWYPMAVFGAIATYAACLTKADPIGSLVVAQTILLAYWLLFELFDLMRTPRSSGAAEWIFPVNAIGFLSLSYAAWFKHAPDHLWIAAACGAALYLASAIARAFLRPPSSFGKADLAARVRQGSFEGATAIAVTLATMAILGGSSRAWSSFAFALEAELLFLAGVAFRSEFLRISGQGYFLASLAALDYPNCTPSALFHAFLFYANRGIRRTGPIFSTVAACLIAFTLAKDLSPVNAALAWVAFGVVLYELGFFIKQIEFRQQGAVLVAAGTLWSVGVQVLFEPQPWYQLAACLAIVYALALQNRGNRILEIGTATATTLTSAVLLWRVVRPDQLGMAWCILAVVLYELGLRKWPEALRWSLLPMAWASTMTFFLVNHDWPVCLTAALCGTVAVVRTRQSRASLSEVEILVGNAVAVLAATAFTFFLWLQLPQALFSIALLALAALLLEVAMRADYPYLKWLVGAESTAAFVHLLLLDVPATNRLLVVPPAIAGLYWFQFRSRDIKPVFSWAAFALLAYLPFAQVEQHAAPYWAAIALGLLAYGGIRNDRDSRIQSYLMSAVAAAFVLGFNVMPANLAVALPVVALFYGGHFLGKRVPEPHVSDAFSSVATALLCAILYGQVSGGMLTVSWGMAGLVLLSAGFPLRERAFRLQGLALLLVCTLKLFLYDLRNLDTPYRILSFIVLGLILMSVSWIYTRFRERVRRIL